MTTTLPAPPIYRTSIGRKMLLAGSGLVILLWLIGHMLGNLKVWLNQPEFDDYAEFLRRLGQPVFPHTVLLWIIRVVLTVAFVVHVYLAVDLSVRNRRARRIRYRHAGRAQADIQDIPAVTMRWGGLALALFVIFHLANFTWGWIHPGYRFVRGQVYNNVVGNFEQWWLVAIYLAAMVALALHIYHGTWSMFQTFGINRARWDRMIRRTAACLAVVMFVGFSSVPVGVLVGAIK